METARVFVRDLGNICEITLAGKTCTNTATKVIRSSNVEIYTCTGHSPTINNPQVETLGIIDFPVTLNPQIVINSLERRVNWIIEDINSSAAKVASRLLEALPRLRETDPVVAIELLDSFSFAWTDSTDKYIEESCLEQEAEDLELD